MNISNPKLKHAILFNCLGQVIFSFGYIYSESFIHVLDHVGHEPSFIPYGRNAMLTSFVFAILSSFQIARYRNWSFKVFQFIWSCGGVFVLSSGMLIQYGTLTIPITYIYIWCCHPI